MLYKQQPFPDNHTDETQFLDQLRTNVNLICYSQMEAVRGAATMMTQLDLAVLYMSIFEFTHEGHLYINGLSLANAVAVVGCLALLLLDGVLPCWKFEHWRTLITVLAFGYAFTPVIRTLTTSISTDTIWASAILLFIGSLVVHDYGTEEAPIASSVLSMNLCLAASVFLISRLKSDLLAFALLGLSLLLFCFWPQLRNAFLARRPKAVLLLFPPLAIASIWALIELNRRLLAIGQLILHLFIVGFCPWLLVRMQKLKSTIHGPWDEATLRASM